MTDQNKKNESCTCDCCGEDVPVSTALTPEGEEYVRHFCGEKCYDKWVNDNKTP